MAWIWKEMYQILIIVSWLAKSVKYIAPVPLDIVGRYDEISPYQIRHLRDVYIFDLNTSSESHAFILYMTGDKIIVMNTYGGYVQFLLLNM
jgi:hypothetical protein